MESLRGYIQTTDIPEQELASRSAIVSSTGLAAEFGWSLDSAPDPPFISRSRPQLEAEREENYNRRCILLVEDNAGDVALVRQALKLHSVDCELVVQTDGEKAVHFIDEVDSGGASCPGLIILDLNLPKRPGRDVLKRIRESPRCGGAHVIILSSSDATQDRVEATALGADRYIRKPSKLDDFMQIGAVVQSLLTTPPS